MNFSELTAGKYVAKIADWGLESVEQMAGKLKAVIKFDIELPSPNGGFVTGTWNGFLDNKDGTPNKKTAKTLVVCGFTDDDLAVLNTAGSLDNSKEYEVTITKVIGKDGTLRTHIEWVNLPGNGGSIKKVQGARASSAFKAALAEARKAQGIKSKPKNHAPQWVKAPVDDDEIPF